MVWGPSSFPAFSMPESASLVDTSSGSRLSDTVRCLNRLRLDFVTNKMEPTHEP